MNPPLPGNHWYTISMIFLKEMSDLSSLESLQLMQNAAVGVPTGSPLWIGSFDMYYCNEFKSHLLYCICTVANMKYGWDKIQKCMSVLFGNVRVCIHLSISYQLKTADILANEINK